MKVKTVSGLLLYLMMMGACSGTDSTDNGMNNDVAPDIDHNSAAIIRVSTSGEPASYTFSVTVASPDTGCTQYADWWEVLRTDGSLVYRRILAHSHVNEQPFTRSGGPVEVIDKETITVRAHMNTIGYGEQVFRGSILNGLTRDTIQSSFLEELAFVDPIPADCAF